MVRQTPEEAYAELDFALAELKTLMFDVNGE
jgi:hypothetical protein